MKLLKNAVRLGATALLGLCATGHAQDGFPNRVIRLVVPYAPGGQMDEIARRLAPIMREKLGQTVIVDNKPGAGGSVAAQFVAKAPADGYTILLHTPNITQHEVIWNKPQYRITEFAPISLLVRLPFVMVVSPQVPARNVTEFVAYAKAHPGKLSYATLGRGGLTHLVGEIFEDEAKIDMVDVPYKGAGPAQMDVMGGQVSMFVDVITSSIEPHKNGRLRAIGITAEKRSPLLPGVPTFAESGYPKMVMGGWNGLFAPAGTPAPVIAKLNAAVVSAIRNPEVVAKLENEGMLIEGSTPEAFSEFIRKDLAVWTPLLQKFAVRVE